jgi:hypothetical protein
MIQQKKEEERRDTPRQEKGRGFGEQQKEEKKSNAGLGGLSEYFN